ncbi:HEPN domain-containing protein [bacterium]|nr:HEPN domain-containing protein [bacterium]MBU0899872.1 HEPN domain-containing protein [bacterium]MBU1152756.1 HEPN domain-containing protein [bacterium]MBU1782656.1 HEPN domain-containing protein [bacterium]MBU2600522.1 HEPN domain-containing protein [bacterium]
MKNRKLAEMFLCKAIQDMIVLEKWRQDPDIAEEILGFHAQQTAEKMLKAVLAYQGIEVPFTHRLTDLIDLGKKHGIILPEKLEDIRFLTPFAVEFRYDIYQEEEEPVDFDGIFVLLIELHKWVNTIICEGKEVSKSNLDYGIQLTNMEEKKKTVE